MLTGSSTIAPLLNEVGKAFEAKHPGVRVDVQSGGSGRGINDARQGVANIGMVSRALKDDERDLHASLFALDGITMIVHRDNPIQTLSDQQITAIYAGTVRDWSEVGGKPGRVTVVNKAEGRSTLELFLSHFKMKAPEIKAQSIIGENEEGIKFVSSSKGAIGYVSIGSALYAIANGVPIRALPLGGVAPTLAAVADRSFPLTRELNLITKDEPQGLVKEFLTFVRSDEVKPLIKAFDFIPYEQGPGTSS
jgi:phosphate transport system substrate-binding protein